MTRIGRFVAAVGSVVIGIVAVVAFSRLMRAFVPDPSVAVAAIWWLGSLVVFGLTVAALYTWAVDGPFVRSRR